MNIGIIKMGLVIYDYGKHPQGGDVEIINFIDILSKEHSVYIISSLDKKARFNKYNGEELDIIYVFNGPWTTDNSAITIFRNYTLPNLLFLNETKVPWVYIQSDNRKTYHPSTPKELTHQPIFTVGMFNEDYKKYWHFDKVNLYGFERKYGIEKSILFGVVMNDTDPKRTKKLKRVVKWLEACKIPVTLRGKMGKNSIVLKESEVPEFLEKVKYTVNIAVEPLSTSQKIWEYMMAGVICFCMDYDMQYNIIPEGHFLRVKDEYELEQKIQLLENNRDDYSRVLEYQYDLMKAYTDGSYFLKIYNYLMKRLRGGEKYG